MRSSLASLARLRLDHLWRLVTRGNPLKDTRGLAALDLRMAAARYTADTLRFLHRRCPGVHFVWIMGAPNLLQFHGWRRWEEIMCTTPVAVIDRPGAALKAMPKRRSNFVAPASRSRTHPFSPGRGRPRSFIYMGPVTPVRLRSCDARPEADHFLSKSGNIQRLKAQKLAGIPTKMASLITAELSIPFS